MNVRIVTVDASLFTTGMNTRTLFKRAVPVQAEHSGNSTTTIAIAASQPVRLDPTLEQCFRMFIAISADPAGDRLAQEAFRGLYEQLNPRLSAYCWKMAGEASGDIMQEFWERIVRLRSKAARESAVDSPLAFCFQIARNLCLDHIRRSPKFEDLGSDIARIEHNTTSDIETVVLEALERLASEDREVLVLNFYSGYGFGEIAEMLGKTPEAIWARASRARIKLRNIVREIAAREGLSLDAIEKSRKKKDDL